MFALTKIWRKLRDSSWDELRLRTQQELDRRSDTLRYRLHLPFATHVNAARGPEPPFFFPPGRARDVIGLIAHMLPDQPGDWVARAERICRHRFDLLGYKDLDYGYPIRWHWDAVHDKEAPRRPWFQVPYLDFEAVGDSKVTWELNRHQHLVVLAKAYCFSGEQRFFDELTGQWYHWCRENPYPIGINWASSLEIAIRSLSWIWVLRLLEGTHGIERFQQDILAMLRLHGRHVQRFLSTYFSPNTHLLGEALGLFFIGTLCPQIPEAHAWKREGWKILCREAGRQVRPDGFYFEQSTYYHVYASDMFLHARVLADRNGMQIPAELDDCISRMLTVLASLVRSGAPSRMGDDDGGRLFDPARNRAQCFSDPLPVGAVLYRRPELAQVANGLCEENIWLLGPDALERADNSSGAPPLAPFAISGRDLSQAPLPSAFPAAGIYVMRSPDHGAQLTIDAGPLGSLAGGHGHADLLSIHLAVDGREVLTDPGTGEYVGINRARFRATSAHNTLEVDGVSQADPDGPFRWKCLPNVSGVWREGTSCQFLRAEHDGYTRLPSPVRHRRIVFHAGKFFFIADEALGSGSHDFAWHWNFGVEANVEQISPRCVLARANQKEVSITVAGDNGWGSEIVPAQVSPAYGQVLPSKRWRVFTRATAPTEIATLISVPGRVSAEFCRVEGSNENVTIYRYATASEAHTFCVGKAGAWTFQDWASDASFAYIGIVAGQPAFVACDFSHFTVAGAPVLAFSQRVDHFEYASSHAKDQQPLSHWLDEFGKSALESLNSSTNPRAGG